MILVILLVIFIVIILPSKTENVPSNQTAISKNSPQKNTSTIVQEKKIEPIPEEKYILPEVKIPFTVELDQKGTVTFRKVTFDGKIITMRYSPDEVQDVPAPADVKQLLTKSKTYVTRDHNLDDLTNDYSSIAAIEFGKFVTEFKTAWYTQNENTIKSGLTIKTCNDATSTDAVIYLKLGSSNKVFYQGDCLIVQGKDSQGLVKAADKLAYLILGIY